MARVDVYLTATQTALAKPGVRMAVREEAEDIGQKAEVLLDVARATTPHAKLGPELVRNPQPSNLTSITVVPSDDAQYPYDWFVCLNAPWPANPVAIEFGHQPSGFFKDKPSKAPEGLYILHRAAGLI